MVPSKRSAAYLAIFRAFPAPAPAAAFFAVLALSPAARAQAPYGAYSTPYPDYSSGYSRSRRSSYQSSSGAGLFGSIFGGGSNQYRYNTYRPRNPYDYGSDPGSYSPSGYGRYRTLCVRTCDGYYYPISFSTTRAGFARDAKQCDSSCSAPARLFVHRNPGADVQHSVDLKGQPYSSLENAFRYREELVDNCRCKPEPWTEAAKEEFERRVAGADTPDAVKTAANQADSQTMTDGAPAAYAEPAPRPQPRRRARYRANDPALEGRWWAGSW